MSDKPREQWVLTLESLPSDVPAANRLRSVLKRLLRQFGFRCIRITGSDQATPPIAPDASTDIKEESNP